MMEAQVWHKVFDSWAEAETQVPTGSLVSRWVGGLRLALARTEEGFFAFEDACPHKLVRLSQGKLCAPAQVECYWHQYRFDLHTGEECTGKNIRPLKVYPLQAQGEGIFVALPPAPEEKDPFSF
ncbi:MAG: Rieske 2Fe-2S domain-containing protein [Microscillaceae bacterium]|nr:Rieske 2Fe-2S domain-containing protein [Microscillaceae bacterium]